MARRQPSDGRYAEARSGLDEIARRLHREQSVCETILWHELRGGRFGGLKFRRQYPIGRHIDDFVCIELRLVIEIDGVSHDENAEKDAERTRLIESHGFTVIRFSNDDVCNHLKGVLRGIDDFCVRRVTTPSPQPSPPITGEREQEFP